MKRRLFKKQKALSVFEISFKTELSEGFPNQFMVDVDLLTMFTYSKNIIDPPQLRKKIRGLHYKATSKFAVVFAFTCSIVAPGIISTKVSFPPG